VIDTCDSGVRNHLFPDGCNFGDQIAACGAGAKNHGQFVSCVAHVVNAWKKAGLITGQQGSRIVRCASAVHEDGDRVASSRAVVPVSSVPAGGEPRATVAGGIELGNRAGVERSVAVARGRREALEEIHPGVVWVTDRDDTIDGALTQEINPITGEAIAIPLTGAGTLFLGKDKIGGNVHLSWSGGAPNYLVRRWDNLIGFGTPAMTTSVGGPSYDDAVLYDGLNECWLVD
jgi:hypothetical protein